MGRGHRRLGSRASACGTPVRRRERQPPTITAQNRASSGSTRPTPPPLRALTMVPQSPRMSCCGRKSAVLRSPRPIAPVSHLWAPFSMSSRPLPSRTTNVWHVLRAPSRIRATYATRAAANAAVADAIGGCANGLGNAPLNGWAGDTLRPQRLVGISARPMRLSPSPRSLPLSSSLQHAQLSADSDELSTVLPVPPGAARTFTMPRVSMTSPARFVSARSASQHTAVDTLR